MEGPMNYKGLVGFLLVMHSITFTSVQKEIAEEIAAMENGDVDLEQPFHYGFLPDGHFPVDNDGRPVRWLACLTLTAFATLLSVVVYKALS